MADSVSREFIVATVLPFLVGWLAGTVAKRWELSQILDTLLRRGQLTGDWSHVTMRKNFCSIVNGKMTLLAFDGTELPPWKANLQRKLFLGLGTMSLAVAIAMINTAASNVSYDEWKVMAVVPVLIAWLYFTLRLRRQRVRTTLSRRSSRNGKKWDTIILEGERADDGIPTKRAGVEK